MNLERTSSTSQQLPTGCPGPIADGWLCSHPDWVGHLGIRGSGLAATQLGGDSRRLRHPSHSTHAEHYWGLRVHPVGQDSHGVFRSCRGGVHHPHHLARRSREGENEGQWVTRRPPTHSNPAVRRIRTAGVCFYIYF